MATVEREGSGGDGVAGDVESLVDLLDLEPLEYNIYRGQNRDIGTGRIYGGQVLAQSLVAAARTVEEDRPVHSLHGYFILAGDLSLPVVYFVDRLRDGGSFTTRRVTAIQHGRAIYNMSASFHRREEGLEHQSAMPDVPGPEGLRSELEMLREMADRIPARLRHVLTQDRPLDIRPVEVVDPFDPEPCLFARRVRPVRASAACVGATRSIQAQRSRRSLPNGRFGQTCPT